MSGAVEKGRVEDGRGGWRPEAINPFLVPLLLLPQLTRVGLSPEAASLAPPVPLLDAEYKKRLKEMLPDLDQLVPADRR